MKKHPLEPIIEQYLSEKDITSGTLDLLKELYKQWINYLKEHKILYPTEQDIEKYLSWKRTFNYSTSWMNHHIGALKGLYGYLSLNQKRLSLPIEYALNISERIKHQIKENKLSKTALSAIEAKQLILSLKDKRKFIWHYRDYAIFYLMLTTGLRSIEVRRAKRKDLKVLKQEHILYVQGKGRSSADEYVKIPHGVLEAITDYLNLRKDNYPFLFISHTHHTSNYQLSRSFFIKTIKRLIIEAGLPHENVTTHALRHTAATLNLSRGGSLETTRKLLRHANITTTLLYAHHLEKTSSDAQNDIENYILDSKIEEDHKNEK